VLRSLFCLGFLLAVRDLAYGQSRVGHSLGCAPPPAEAQLPPTTDHSNLAGGYDITLISEGPEFAGRRVSGVLWLWRSSPADSSPSTGKRALASDSARHPYYGATDLDLWHLKRQGPATEAALKAQTDPVYPEVLVGISGGPPADTVWKGVSLWIESVGNRRDGGLGLDGAGFVLQLSELRDTGFSGHWGPAGIVQTEEGYFCATRRSAPVPE
jgi:hypothetical protein